MNKFPYNGKHLEVTADMKQAFDRDGFIIVNGLFSKEELDIVETALHGPDSLTAETYAFGRQDGDGRKARMSMWNNAGSDTTGIIARMRKMAGTAEKLLGGEVYHYHSKLIMKDAETGGKFVWHQDYGYWYNFNCLFPDMMTTFVALDNCDKDNGCLQILKGSHKCGRIDHVEIGDQAATYISNQSPESAASHKVQVGADLERVAEIGKVCDKLYVELDKGDTMFFHCNLLHTSAQNLSEKRRWALLACYSRDHNNPYEKKTHALYTPLEQVDNDALLKTGVNRQFEGKDLIKPVNGAMQTIVA